MDQIGVEKSELQNMSLKQFLVRQDKLNFVGKMQPEELGVGAELD